MFLTTSDAHINPGEDIPPYLLEMFHECDVTGERAIVVGDLINLLPYGLKAWYTPAGQRTIKELVDALPEAGVDYIFGNHEGNINWLIKMFKDYPRVRVARELNLTINGQPWHFEHGHRFAYDWRWLQWIADDATQFMVKVFPGFWIWLSKKLGWMPSGVQQSNPTKYKAIIGTIWDNALKWAQKNQTNLVIGHTHCHCETTLNDQIKLIDCGAKRVVRI